MPMPTIAAIGGVYACRILPHSRPRTGFVAKMAVVVAVGKVNDQSDSHPVDQADPSVERKTVHQIGSRNDCRNRNERAKAAP